MFYQLQHDKNSKHANLLPYGLTSVQKWHVITLAMLLKYTQKQYVSEDKYVKLLLW